jgi:transposase
MENVAFHRTAAIRQLIADNGATIKYLPPYSPFFNPIENVFSQWKHWVRTFEPRNDEELRAAMHQARDRITRQNCENYFRHARSNCLQSVLNRILL